MGSRNAAVVSFHFRHIFAICWPSEKMPPGLVTESTIWSAVPSALFICRSSTYTRPFLNTNSFWKVPLGLFCGAGAHSSQSLMGKIKDMQLVDVCIFHHAFGTGQSYPRQLGKTLADLGLGHKQWNSSHFQSRFHRSHVIHRPRWPEKSTWQGGWNQLMVTDGPTNKKPPPIAAAIGPPAYLLLGALMRAIPAKSMDYQSVYGITMILWRGYW